MTDIEIIAQSLFEPTDIVELRCIRGKAPNAEIESFWTYARDLSSMADKLQKYNHSAYNIYYGVNPRRERFRRGDANVLLARCLFVDFDNIEPGDGCGRLEFILCRIDDAGLPEPTLCVHSGHGIHCYWRLAEPMTDLAQWKDTQIKLNHTLKSDPSIKNPERIMRLAGYRNTKKEPFQDCFIVWRPNADR